MLIITVSNAKNHSNILKYFLSFFRSFKGAIMCGKISKTLDFNPWDFFILNFLIDFRAICVHMQVARLCRMKLDKKCNLIPHSDFFLNLPIYILYTSRISKFVFGIFKKWNKTVFNSNSVENILVLTKVGYSRI